MFKKTNYLVIKFDLIDILRQSLLLCEIVFVILCVKQHGFIAKNDKECTGKNN